MGGASLYLRVLALYTGAVATVRAPFDDHCRRTLAFLLPGRPFLCALLPILRTFNGKPEKWLDTCLLHITFNRRGGTKGERMQRAPFCPTVSPNSFVIRNGTQGVVHAKPLRIT